MVFKEKVVKKDFINCPYCDIKINLKGKHTILKHFLYNAEIKELVCPDCGCIVLRFYKNFGKENKNERRI